ncbi:hypothetical protein ACIQLG_03880 [Terribacillus saccharophilus]|uniref:DUF6414 family protein n=1 Tax=Terribacillus saccharophilus TaxID=361277 RepID=UPI0037FD0B1A
MYRDFIYFDNDKVNSILAQTNKGLIESIVKGDSHTGGGEVGAKTGALASLFGFTLNGKGKYEYSRNNQSNKSLHDYAFNMTLDSLDKQLKDASQLDRSQLSGKTFIKIKGKVKIYDYMDLSNMLSKIMNADSLLSNESDDNGELEKFSKFIQEIYGNLTIIEITNGKNVGFIGLVKNESMRESMRDIVFKYGTSPDKDWEMLCQITRIPKNGSNDLNQIMRNFGQSINGTDIGSKKSLGEHINKIITEFSKVYDAFASVSYPNIAVEPIAVYRVID